MLLCEGPDVIERIAVMKEVPDERDCFAPLAKTVETVPAVSL